MNGGRGNEKGCLLVFFVKGARTAIVYVLTVLETQNLEPDRTIWSFTIEYQGLKFILVGGDTRCQFRINVATNESKSGRYMTIRSSSELSLVKEVGGPGDNRDTLLKQPSLRGGGGARS